MVVDTETAEYRSEYGEETFYFCSPGCKAAFEEDPARYAEQGSES
jgi:YHS domain-containing protein